jgi:hypothetical protein
MVIALGALVVSHGFSRVDDGVSSTGATTAGASGGATGSVVGVSIASSTEVTPVSDAVWSELDAASLGPTHLGSYPAPRPSAPWIPVVGSDDPVPDPDAASSRPTHLEETRARPWRREHGGGFRRGCRVTVGGPTVLTAQLVARRR